MLQFPPHRLSRRISDTEKRLLDLVFSVQLSGPPGSPKSKEKKEDFYANVGDAIRTLREDVPTCLKDDINCALFDFIDSILGMQYFRKIVLVWDKIMRCVDVQYQTRFWMSILSVFHLVIMGLAYADDIYRDDIIFRDPRNCFCGIKNYKIIFWSLRFHGRLFFKELYVEVKRIWQKDDHTIFLRWTVHGFPRLPWDQEGTFDGVSTYKLDCHGKVCHVLTIVLFFLFTFLSYCMSRQHLVTM